MNHNLKSGGGGRRRERKKGEGGKEMGTEQHKAVP